MGHSEAWSIHEAMLEDRGAKLREGGWFVAAKLPHRVPTFRCTAGRRSVEACLCETVHVPQHLKERTSRSAIYSVNVVVSIFVVEAKSLIYCC